MPTTVKSKPKPRKSAKRRKPGSLWIAWIIVALGFAAIPIGLHMASILALAGPGALAILYPFVVLVKASSLGIPISISGPVAQAILYAQFPLYGLFVAWVYRSRGILIALSAVICLHIVACGTAIWLVQAHLRF